MEFKILTRNKSHMLMIGYGAFGFSFERYKLIGVDETNYKYEKEGEPAIFENYEDAYDMLIENLSAKLEEAPEEVKEEE